MCSCTWLMCQSNEIKCPFDLIHPLKRGAKPMVVTLTPAGPCTAATWSLTMHHYAWPWSLVQLMHAHDSLLCYWQKHGEGLDTSATCNSHCLRMCCMYFRIAVAGGQFTGNSSNGTPQHSTKKLIQWSYTPCQILGLKSNVPKHEKTN